MACPCSKKFCPGSNLKKVICLFRSPISQHWNMAHPVMVKHKDFKLSIDTEGSLRFTFIGEDARGQMCEYAVENIKCLSPDSVEEASRDYAAATTKFKQCLHCCAKHGHDKGRLRVCGGCLRAYYCGRHCQKRSWNKTHRFVCAALLNKR